MTTTVKPRSNILKGGNAKGLLYTVAYLVLVKGTWEARFEHSHGENAAAVKNAFCRALPRGFYLGVNVSITGIAPSIGYFLEGERRVDGKTKIILSAD